MVKKLTEWNPTGSRPKGRQKRRWMEDELDDRTKLGEVE
jgi:hypothetical protein